MQVDSARLERLYISAQNSNAGGVPYMQNYSDTIGLFRLPDSRASRAITAMVEEIQQMGDQPSPIVFFGRQKQNGISIPTMLVVDLYNRATYVSLDGFAPVCSHLAPTWAIKRARRLSKMLLRQYLAKNGRRKVSCAPQHPIEPAFQFACSPIQA